MPGSSLNIPGSSLVHPWIDPISTLDGHIFQYFAYKPVLDSLDNPGGPLRNDRFFLVDQPCLSIVSISLIGCSFRPEQCPMLILTYLNLS